MLPDSAPRKMRRDPNIQALQLMASSGAFRGGGAHRLLPSGILESGAGVPTRHFDRCRSGCGWIFAESRR